MKILTDPQAFWDMIDSEHSPHWPVICIDFNGVLDQHQGWNGSIEYTEPALHAGAFLSALRVTFNTIVILTACIDLEGVVEWLNKYGLSAHIDYVSNIKVPAACYVDDRAITHTGNFGETLAKISDFNPWWKDNGNA